MRVDHLLSQNALEYNPFDPKGREAAVTHYNVTLWSEIQTILSAGATVSRILFPRPPRRTRPRTSRDRLARRRAIAAGQRAKMLWDLDVLPSRKTLRPLWEPGARNAMEHVENGAPDWYESVSVWPIMASGFGDTPPKGTHSGLGESFRYLFRDSRRVKVGRVTCDLNAILSTLKLIEDSVPTRAGIDIAGLVFLPTASLPDGSQVVLNACPLSTAPPPASTPPSGASPP